MTWRALCPDNSGLPGTAWVKTEVHFPKCAAVILRVSLLQSFYFFLFESHTLVKPLCLALKCPPPCSPVKLYLSLKALLKCHISIKFASPLSTKRLCLFLFPSQTPLFLPLFSLYYSWNFSGFFKSTYLILLVDCQYEVRIISYLCNFLNCY